MAQNESRTSNEFSALCHNTQTRMWLETRPSVGYVGIRMSCVCRVETREQIPKKRKRVFVLGSSWQKQQTALVTANALPTTKSTARMRKHFAASNAVRQLPQVCNKVWRIIGLDEIRSFGAGARSKKHRNGIGANAKKWQLGFRNSHAGGWKTAIHSTQMLALGACAILISLEFVVRGS